MKEEVVLITAIALLAFILRYFLRNIKKDELPSTGFIARAIFEEIEKQYNRPLIGGLIWFLVSFILGMVCPFMDGNTLWFKDKVGIIITVNYTVIVPILCGCYLYTAESARVYSPSLSKMSNSSFYRIQTVIIITTLSITLMAAESELNYPSGSASPWVTDKEFTTTGLLYYSIVRGLNTYMALGLVFSILWVGSKALKMPIERRLNSNNALNEAKKYLEIGKDVNIFPRVKTKILHVVSALVYSIAIGSIVTILHGLALMLLDEKNSLKVEGPVEDTLFDTSWMFWFIFTIVTTVCMIVFVVWTFKNVKISYRYYKKYRLSKVPLKRRPELDRKIQEEIDSLKFLPLPKSTWLVFVISLSLDILNLLGLLKEFFK